MTRYLPLLGLALITSLTTAGCASRRGHADSLMAKGDYNGAANVYDDIATTNPKNDEARALRDVARNRALGQMLARAQAARSEKRTADWLSEMDALLAKRAEWNHTPDGAIKPGIDVEVKAVTLHARSTVGALASAQQPLRAEAALTAMNGVLRHAELSATRADLTNEVARAGRATCDKLAATMNDAYFAFVVDRYCHHWGGQIANIPVPPHAYSAARVEGGITGAPESDSAWLREQVSAWFSETRWHSPRATNVAGAHLGGQSVAAVNVRRISVEKPWSEQVPYSAMEAYQEPYQEPYSTNEYVTREVPYTVLDTVSYECGSPRRPRTCTRSQTVTRYRTEGRMQMVTRYRTVYRTATRVVTRYRSESRSYRYEADEVTGRYTSDIGVRVDLGGGVEPLFVKVDAHDTKRGVSHNVTFGPAGIAPEQANVPTREVFFRTEAQKLHDQFTAAFKQHYERSFCSAPQYTVEEASRCAYGTTRYPAAAHAAFTTVFGDDAALLPAVIASP